MSQVPVKAHRKRGERFATPLPAATLNPSWNEAADVFLRAAQAENLSVATMQNFRSYLLGPRAKQFLVDYEIEVLSDVTPQKLRDFQAELLEVGLAPGTVATFHRILQNFLGFCRREGWLVSEGVKEVAAPRIPQEEPDTFTADEERRLLAAAESARDRFLVEFLLRTGVRLSEAANVTLDDIVQGVEGSYVRVRQGKGRKDRIVPLDSSVVKFSKKVEAYIKQVRPAATSSRHLFLSTRMDRSNEEYSAMTSFGIQCLVRRLGEKTGIHCYPHKFRHTFATRALASGVDVMALQRVLGHTTLSMVARYVHYQSEDLIQAWKFRRE